MIRLSYLCSLWMHFSFIIKARINSCCAMYLLLFLLQSDLFYNLEAFLCYKYKCSFWADQNKCCAPQVWSIGPYNLDTVGSVRRLWGRLNSTGWSDWYFWNAICDFAKSNNEKIDIAKREVAVVNQEIALIPNIKQSKRTICFDLMPPAKLD